MTFESAPAKVSIHGIVIAVMAAMVMIAAIMAGINH